MCVTSRLDRKGPHLGHPTVVFTGVCRRRALPGAVLRIRFRSLGSTSTPRALSIAKSAFGICLPFDNHQRVLPPAPEVRPETARGRQRDRRRKELRRPARSPLPPFQSHPLRHRRSSVFLHLLAAQPGSDAMGRVDQVGPGAL